MGKGCMIPFPERIPPGMSSRNLCPNIMGFVLYSTDLTCIAFTTCVRGPPALSMTNINMDHGMSGELQIKVT